MRARPRNGPSTNGVRGGRTGCSLDVSHRGCRLLTVSERPGPLLLTFRYM